MTGRGRRGAIGVILNQPIVATIKAPKPPILGALNPLLLPQNWGLGGGSTQIYAIDCTTTKAIPIPIVTKAAVRNRAKSITLANCDTPKAIANCTALNPAK
jgi:hypothetical protein